MPSKNFHRWTKEFGHTFLLLIVIIVISILLGQLAFVKGWEAIYRGLFRFFRIAFFLCVSLLLLSPIFGNLGFIMRGRKGFLSKLEANRNWRSIL
jgi:phosphoglycerol transferase MdoB-like AlkP superfamily enzyme